MSPVLPQAASLGESFKAFFYFFFLKSVSLSEILRSESVLKLRSLCVQYTERFPHTSGLCPHHNPKPSQPGETKEEVEQDCEGLFLPCGSKGGQPKPLSSNKEKKRKMQKHSFTICVYRSSKKGSITDEGVNMLCH